MRITKVYGKYFGSYKEIEFDLSNLGLTGVFGPTKAGKSTLMDLAPWALFGKTSKGLSADGVKSWFADDATVGRVSVELPGEIVEVTRIRGKRPSDNDLFFYVYRNGEHGDSEPTRGKDAVDTQRLINEKLGVSPDLFIASAYIHQFSTDSFFEAKAKDRRETFEKIANLSVAINLGEKASEARKAAKKALDQKLLDQSKLHGKLETTEQAIANAKVSEEKWDAQRAKDLSALQEKLNNYDTEKQAKVLHIVDQLEELDGMIAPAESFKKRIDQLKQQGKALDALEADLRAADAERATHAANLRAAKSEFDRYNKGGSGPCPTCLGTYDNPNRHKHLATIEKKMQFSDTALNEVTKEIARLTEATSAKHRIAEGIQKVMQEQAENNRLVDRYETLRAQAIALRGEENPYAGQLERLASEPNPYVSMLANENQKLTILLEQIDKVDKETRDLERKVNALTWLYERSFVLRGMLLERAVKQINDSTNAYLERFFDATIRVRFELTGSDKLDVAITNEGYDCEYTQLSGGERCMLRLAFSVGYMQQAQNVAGVKISTLMLDEALNGLDDGLKLRAMSLIETLAQEYETVLLIEHSEAVKSQFESAFMVTKEGAYSTVERV
jgi:DNA repair exonuclease SbcCD ATPase subunit